MPLATLAPTLPMNVRSATVGPVRRAALDDVARTDSCTSALTRELPVTDDDIAVEVHVRPL